MLTISPVNNNKNNSQPSFGLDYTKATRKYLKKTAHSFVKSFFDEQNNYDDAKIAIRNLGELRKRQDGLVIDIFDFGLGHDDFIGSEVYIKHKNCKNPQNTLISTGLHDRAINWFIKKTQKPFDAYSDKPKNIIEASLANDLLVDTIYYGQQVGHTGSKNLLVTSEYLKSQEFLEETAKSFEKQCKGEADYKKEQIADYFSPRYSDPIYLSGKKPSKIRKIIAKIANVFEEVTDRLDEKFNDVIDNYPLFYILNYTKEQRAQIKELRKLINEQLG